MVCATAYPCIGPRCSACRISRSSVPCNRLSDFAMTPIDDLGDDRPSPIDCQGGARERPGTDHQLDIGNLPRTPWCNVNLFDAHSFLRLSCEGIAVDSVAVPNHKPGSAVFRKCFDDLLCGPNRRGMLRDIEVNDAASIVR